ncbi:amidohydrolase family protein [Catenulispora pinisilvae]|uniref:amidohydrolase family protein n=1 Tax=Catenulispora pinisilvae TaxID=2705253 RepID=UPI001890CF5B|nr:amidohydrolase family protein [Catenulispora pinisilvae]
MPTSRQQEQLDKINATTGDNNRRILLSGAHVITMDAQGEFVGDVLIAGDRIEALGPGLAARVDGNAIVVDVAGSVVIPGLVDSHIHAWQGQLRGMAPDATFADYMSLTHGKLGKAYRPQDMAIAERLTAAQALNAGTTTIVDNSHNSRSAEHSDAAIEALRGSGIRAVYAAGPAQEGDHQHQLPADVLRLRDTYSRADGLITIRLMDSWPTLESWAFAAEHDIDVSSEIGGWITDSEALLTSGLLRPGHTLNHCSGLSDKSWAAIADSGAAVNVVPRSDSNLGLGAFIPILAVNRRGIQEGISSDNEMCYAHDLFTEMRVLQTVQRGLSFGEMYSGAADSPAPYGALDALRAATVGGALNAALSDQIGTLAAGKKADLVVLSLDRVNTRISGSAVGSVVNFAGIANVDAVFVNGAVAKWGGDLVGLDYESLARAGEASKEYLLANS